MKRMDYVLVILTSAMCALSRLPLYTGWLIFIAWLPMMYFFNTKDRRWFHLLLSALIFNVVNVLIWLSWIGEVTLSGLIGMILLFTGYYFLVFWIINRIWHKLPSCRLLGLITVLLTYEYLQNFGELRFAWFDLGYSLSDYTVLIQAADLGGVTLLSLLILIITTALWQVLQRKWKYLILIGLILVVWVGYGWWRLKALPLERQSIKIAVMQPSIPQDEKWEGESFNMIYNRYIQLIAASARDSMQLIIMPEAAMPAYLMRDAGFARLVQQLSDAYNIDIFIGFPDYKPAPIGYPGGAYYYNAATLFRPHQPYDKPYYKNILVPVGERMPWMDKFPFLWKLQFGQANWEYGNAVEHYCSQGKVFSPSICYELAFARHFNKMTYYTDDTEQKKKADFLVNITNDAWFGTSYGPWVHAAMSKFRAVENRVQIYRSANTGISLIVDPKGRFVEKTKLFEIKNISQPLFINHERTLYSRIEGYQFIYLIGTVLLFICSIVFVFRYRKNAIQGASA